MDDQKDISVGAGSQGRAQVLNDEIALSLSCEDVDGENTREGDLGKNGLILSRDGPKRNIPTGIFIQEPELQKA